MRKYISIILVFISIVVFSASFTISNSSNNIVSKKKHTITHYDNEIRRCFKENRWDAGLYMLGEATNEYDGIYNFYELHGWYYLHNKEYNKARYNLTKCLQNDNTNTHARELLVDVEEYTKHYSSALCYVNEILENNPYSKKWWIRKINLYKKLGNNVESERCLVRLNQIYPEDDNIKNEVSEKLIKDLKISKNKKNIQKTIDISKKLIELYPNSDNYVHLVNALYNGGRISDACSYAVEGYNKTHSSILLKKYIGMLCEQGKHYEALYFLSSIGDKSSSLRSEIENDMASYSNINDPYMVYARIYDKTHSKESFDYLVNTGLIKGYYDAVIDYINDYQKRNKNVSTDILYKKYTAYERLGNEEKSLTTLEAVYKNKHTKDIADELSNLYYKKANKLILDSRNDEALHLLRFIENNSTDKDLRISVKNKISGCYFDMKMYDEYISSLDKNDSLYNNKVATALSLQHKYNDALTYATGNTYTEIAIPYIKELIGNHEYEKSLNIIDTALTYTNDKVLYMYAISCSDKLHKDAIKYIIKGYESYSFDDYFINQYSGYLKDSTLYYIKEKEYDKAFTNIDSALIIKPNDKELLYTKGLIFEKVHMYDSAYVYQKKYNPDISDTYTYKAKLNGLYMKTLNNAITIDYHQARLGQLDVITSNTNIEYEHIMKNKNSWALGVGYIGRDDAADENEYITEQTPGGIGLLFSGRYTYYFKKDWSGSLSASYGTKYFPKFNIKLNVSKELKNDWVLSGNIQYRMLDSYKKLSRLSYDETGTESYVFNGWEHNHQNMFSIGLSANKTINNFDINFGINGYLINKNTYVSANTKIQYMPIEGSKTRIYVTAGCGTAPEISLLDYAMPKSFEKINANVGLGGVYVLTKNISIGLEGSWYTMYKQTEILGKQITNKTSYVNLFYIHPQVFITF